MLSKTALSLRLRLRNLRRRPPNTNSISTDGEGEESEVYQASRKLARPATVRWSERLHNSASLIGTVEYPPKKFDSKDGKFGVHSILLVKPSPTSPSHFRIAVSMWDSLAERALVHLKPNDYIYVSGQLGSYTKSTIDGAEKMYYKLTATELNYVQVPDENYKVAVGSKADVGESGEEKHRKRLHMWQLLFANPEEWYDNRNTKKSPRHPDFKHKNTGEALWLNSYDPPWVKNQVELLDSRLAGTPRDEVPFESSTSSWVSDLQLDSSNSMEADLLNHISDRE